jgi:hypothetical protein
LACFINYGNDPAHPEKLTKFALRNSTIEISAFKDFKKGEEVLFSSPMNGQNLFVHHGVVLDNNDAYDCYGIQLTFKGNKDDPLAQKRKDFFAKFFLYDSPQIDVM